MDRPNLESVPFIDETVEGWDAHTVWQERVLATRRRPNAVADATLLDSASGWDPLETWRIRVNGPRRSAA